MSGLAADQTGARPPSDLGTSELTDAEVCLRGAKTLLASWEQYGAAGFRDLGRILEYVPPASEGNP